jgi:hypothetical protein
MLPGAFRADFIGEDVEVKAYRRSALVSRIVRELNRAHDPLTRGDVRSPAVLRVGPLIDGGAAERPDEPSRVPADGDQRGRFADAGRE